MKVDKLKLNEIEEIIRNQVPLNCKMTTWGLWSVCSHTCGTGNMTRTRSIIGHPANGGRECGDQEMVQSCNLGACPGPECPDGWSEFSGSCFTLLTDYQEMDTCRKECQAQGGDLA